MTDDLLVDPSRSPQLHEQTGIYIRAKLGDQWGNYDIGELTLESLMRFLRSRGGSNEYAEKIIALLLGHELP